MSGPQEDAWLDDDAGRLVRPYTVSDGRTRPTTDLDLLTLVMATGEQPAEYLGPEHSQILDLCRASAMSVAEIAALVRQPATVTKVLLSDLVDLGAVLTRGPVHLHSGPDPTDPELLEAVLDGLRKRL